jgi:PAS domain-containing protein
MTMFLDMRTLTLVCGIISASLIVCLVYTYKYRKTYPGFNKWTLAFLCNFIGFILLGFRGVLPDYITVILANTLVVACYVLIARGMNEFASSEQNDWMDIISVLAVVLLFFYFTYVLPNVNIRIGVISTVLIFVCLRCVHIAHRKIAVELDKSNLLLTASFLLAALWLSSRIVLTVYFEAEIKDFLEAGSIQGVSIMVATIVNLLIAVSLLSINSQKLEKEINIKTLEIGEANRKLQLEIKEREEVQEQLRDSKLLLDATGRMAGVGGWEIDADTLEVRWTAETYRIHEVSPDYRPPLSDAIRFFHPDDREMLSNGIQRALDHGEPYDLELRLVTAKNNLIWARSICRPEVVDGRTVKLKGAFQDITGRKKADAEREKLIVELQKALKEIKTLKGIFPICSHCKKIRDDKGLWNQIEEYIQNHSDAEFSHSICRECAEKFYPDMHLYDD